jgi:hypothetical protein
MSTDRTASDVIDDLAPAVPQRPAGTILDADAMAREGERQARQLAQDDAARNAGGSPIQNVPRG